MSLVSVLLNIYYAWFVLLSYSIDANLEEDRRRRIEIRRLYHCYFQQDI